MNEMEQKCFEMINQLSSSKTLILQAIDQSEIGNLAKADELMNAAKHYSIEAQKIHLQLLAKEANGEQVEISLLFMHTEDQMITVQLLFDIAKKLITMNGKICLLS